MSIDLERLTDGTSFGWTFPYWGAVLELAYKYGWKPAGTQLKYDMLDGSEVFDWNGGYHSNDGQIITPDDARGIADALERALPDIPDEEAIAGKLETSVFPPQTKEEGGEVVQTVVRGFEPEAWESLNVLERLAGGQDKLRDFIEYLRGDGCRIY